LIVSVLGIAAICLRALETHEVRAKRTERNKKKELRSLAERISSYGHTVHQRYAIKCYVAMAGDANPGNMSNLEVHHTEFRKQSGDDSEKSITLEQLNSASRCLIN